MTPSFLAELQRRRVYRTAAIYAGAAFVVWQVADIALPALGAPEWIMRLIVIAALVGFPVVLVLAWLVQLAPRGARRLRWAVVGVVGLALVGGAVALVARVGMPGPEPDPSERSLAVLPFYVRGTPGLDYLRDGLVDLLSRNLGGSDLDPVDPSAVVKAAGTPEAPLSMTEGAAVARRLGARHYVLGSVNQIGARVRIHATLYALSDSVRMLASGEQEGDTLELFDMVDRLTAELLVGRSPGAASRRVIRTAATTTASLPALKLYLEGEREFRVGEHSAAIAKFGEALEQDSTFALARMRRAMSHALSGSYEGARADVDRLAAADARLSEHDRRVLAAFTAHLEGRLDDAERAYRAVVRDYPADIEAKVLLAQMIDQYAPLRGRPRADAKPLLDEVEALDPEFLCINCMQQGIALEQRDYERLVEIADRRNAVAGMDTTRAWFTEWLRVLHSGDARQVDAFLGAASAAHDSVQYRQRTYGMLVVAQSLGHMDAAERAIEAARADGVHPATIAWLEYTQASATGRNRDVVAVVTRLRRMSPAFPPRRHAALLLGHAPPRYDGLDELRARLLEWEPVGRDIADVLRPRTRWLYLGLVDSRRGDARATQWADSLREAALRTSGIDSVVLADMAHTIRADHAWRSGDAVAAAGWLDRLRTDLPPALLDERSDYLYYATDLRSYVYVDAGRFEDAVRWLSYGPDGMRADYNYADWHFAMARALEGLGRAREAAAHYERSLAAWQSADPELHAQREYARRRLTDIRIE